MNSSWLSELRRIIEQPSNGVVGLVDELLKHSAEQGLSIEWTTNRCRVRSRGGQWEELGELPIRPSVFRAVLARIAALCQERMPNPVSPYGGHGELSFGLGPATVFDVAFTNTPEVQSLLLTIKDVSSMLEAGENGHVHAAESLRAPK